MLVNILTVFLTFLLVQATCCKLYDDFFEKKNRTEATDLEHNKEPSREKHLKWLLGMGTCHIETEIGGKKVELIVTTAQVNW